MKFSKRKKSLLKNGIGTAIELNYEYSRHKMEFEHVIFEKLDHHEFSNPSYRVIPLQVQLNIK